MFTEEERLHGEAMMFKAQCLWRNYEVFVEGPHSKRAADQMLNEIDELEANLRDLGVFAHT